ncbi:phage tail family protein [Acetanaerobacterium elongatum]|uniref:Phage tail protein n=1 Tax=Acetanaerobacterium elongatum TaxID=258515 RepID=A0A1H0EA27_9FIRM|nr:phage tail family protein [Acetanaerobacterium elongatum]SDN79195.1 Phage tail protein [Acetanaerobacterium elongatum]
MRKIERLVYTNQNGESVEFSHDSLYHTDDVSGLADVRNTIYSVNSMGQDGDTYVGNRIESREIEIVGCIRSRKKEEMLALRRRLNKVLNPQLSATLTYSYGDFIRVIDCKANNAPVYAKPGVFAGFTVNLLCLDPFWRENAETKAAVASWLGSLEFETEIPMDTGMELGYREPSRIVNVFNAGDVGTGIRAEFRATGTVSNPEILNVDTGEYLRFNNLTLSAGDLLTVSTHYGRKVCTLKQNGAVTDALRYLDVDSAFLQLVPGDNLFRYSATAGENNLEVSVYHNNKYLGV